MDKKYFYICLFILGFLTSYIVERRHFSKYRIRHEEYYDVEKYKEVRNNLNYKFINPLLECEGNNIPLLTTKGIEDKINDYISMAKLLGKSSEIAVYYRDLNSGPWFGINEDILFRPASLLKVPIMMTYFSLAEEDKNILSKEID